MLHTTHPEVAKYLKGGKRLVYGSRAINEGGVARLRSATENVERSLHKIAEELYKTTQAAGAAGQAGAAAGAGAGGGSSAGSSGAQEKKPGDVIDAEYVDVDETKRPN